MYRRISKESILKLKNRIIQQKGKYTYGYGNYYNYCIKEASFINRLDYFLD